MFHGWQHLGHRDAACSLLAGIQPVSSCHPAFPLWVATCTKNSNTVNTPNDRIFPFVPNGPGRGNTLHSSRGEQLALWGSLACNFQSVTMSARRAHLPACTYWNLTLRKGPRKRLPIAVSTMNVKVEALTQNLQDIRRSPPFSVVTDEPRANDPSAWRYD